MRLSQISPEATIGSDVEIGAFCVVHPNVVIEDDVTIGSHCVIGHPAATGPVEPLRIGRGARVRSHSVIYEGSTFAPGLETGHAATLREGIHAGENLRVGTSCDLQGDSTIGEYVRLHSGVFVCRGTAIEDFAWVFMGTVFTDDPHPPNDRVRAASQVGRYAVVAASVTVLPGVRIGEDALVGARSLVTRDVEPGTVVAGVPASPRGRVSEIELRDGTGEPAYPWRRHFRRGYPDEVVQAWRDQLDPTSAKNSS
jgi:acetyltransferase-like isoleucine patch superfamily enzyme